MLLTGHTIFITGGSAGIGLALAKAFLALDNCVIICGRNPEKLASAKEKHPGLHTIVCDITDEARVKEVTAQLTTDFPALNVLINNAATISTYQFLENAEAFETISHEITTNLLAPLRITHRLLPHLAKQSEAALVNITTGTAWVPMPAAPGYSATKAAMHSLTQSMRFQLRDTPIRVFEVIPPLVDTDMARQVDVVDEGHRKMHPDVLAQKVLKGMRKDRLEMRIGMNALLYWLHRIWPAMALKILQHE